MKKSFILIIVAIALAAVFSGCSGKIKGDGKMVDEKLSYDGSITKIEMGDIGATLNVTAAENNEVTYTIDENLKDLLDITVKSGVLKIGAKSKKDFTSKEGITFHVGTDQLEELIVDGAVKANLSGATDQLTVTVEGAANIKARDYIVQDLSITMEGAGLAEVYAEKTLNATIEGAAKVTYWGNPEVTKSIDGIGSVKKGD